MLLARLSSANCLQDFLWASFKGHANRLFAVCGLWSEHWQADLPLLQPLKHWSQFNSWRATALHSLASTLNIICLSPQYTVLHILFYCTSYSSLFCSPIFMYILLFCVTYFALSTERTWSDLHFITDYILYNLVCDEYNLESMNP